MLKLTTLPSKTRLGDKDRPRGNDQDQRKTNQLELLTATGVASGEPATELSPFSNNDPINGEVRTRGKSQVNKQVN